ncbi:hypothetical protein ECE50_000035 [Chitinophaga sp. Mgbs1]|uniref:Uncharacterized protein n=1 Tax=Chitinophaga solisilvae TaxID=1233460 RepID=A0A3S1CZY5_9BACT|nr:hypothetical protein [Chitinophaga solisilvae]
MNIQLYQQFENFLGDTGNKDALFGFDILLMLDEQALYPEKQIDALNEWGLNSYFIPADCGGKLKCLDDIYHFFYLLARRDLTTAIAYGGTFLGAMSVWINGNDVQKEDVADCIRQHRKIAFSLTERGNGSDLLQTRVTAKYQTDKNTFELNGEKWLFNHASKCHFACVLVKTDPGDSPRSFSLLYTPMAGEIPENGSLKTLDRILTSGLRGLDLGGVEFCRYEVAASSVIGCIGSGFESSVTALQVTKTLLGGLALGSLDTLLRTTIAFCLERILYKKPIIRLPVLREKIVSVFLDKIIADAFCLSGVRLIQVFPAQLSLYSALIKASVPSMVEKSTVILTGLLGARAFIMSEGPYRIFQKQVRDNAIIPVFEGNVYVNYQLVIRQLEVVFSLIDIVPSPDRGMLRKIYEIHTPLPALDFTRLSVTSKGKHDLAFSLTFLYDEIIDTYMGIYDQSIKTNIKWLIDEYVRTQQWFLNEMKHSSTPYEIEAASFYHAERYTVLQAVSAAACMIWYNREELCTNLDWRLLLKLCLCKAKARLTAAYFEAGEDGNAIIDYIIYCQEKGYSFSLFPMVIK